MAGHAPVAPGAPGAPGPDAAPFVGPVAPAVGPAVPPVVAPVGAGAAGGAGAIAGGAAGGAGGAVAPPGGAPPAPPPGMVARTDGNGFCIPPGQPGGCMVDAGDIPPGTIHAICGMGQHTHIGAAGNVGPTGISLFALNVDRAVKSATVGIESSQLAKDLAESGRALVRAFNSSLRTDARAGLVIPQALPDPTAATTVPRAEGLAETAYERTNTANESFGKLSLKYISDLQRCQQATKTAPEADLETVSVTPPNHPWSSTVALGILKGKYHPAGSSAAPDIADCVRVRLVSPSVFNNFAFTHAVGARVVATVLPTVDMYATFYQTMYTMLGAVRAAHPALFTPATKAHAKALKNTLKLNQTKAIVEALVARRKAEPKDKPPAEAKAKTGTAAGTGYIVVPDGLNAQQRRNYIRHRRTAIPKRAKGTKPIVNNKFAYVAG